MTNTSLTTMAFEVIHEDDAPTPGQLITALIRRIQGLMEDDDGTTVTDALWDPYGENAPTDRPATPDEPILAALEMTAVLVPWARP